MLKNIRDIYPVILFLLVISIIAYIDGLSNIFIPTLSLLITISAWLFRYRIRNLNLSNFFLYATIASFIHFSLFPIGIDIILKIDKDSFDLNPKILENERNDSVRQLNETVDLKDIEANIVLIDSILNNNGNSGLTTAFSYFENDNIERIENFLFFVAKRSGGPEKPDLNYLITTNVTGKKVAEFRVFNMDHQQTLQDFLKTQKKELSTEKDRYKGRLIEIGNNQFWTVSKLFPYMVNYSRDNIKAISKSAQILQGAHSIVVNGILLVFAIQFLSTFIANRKKDNSSDNFVDE